MCKGPQEVAGLYDACDQYNTIKTSLKEELAGYENSVNTANTGIDPEVQVIFDNFCNYENVPMLLGFINANNKNDNIYVVSKMHSSDFQEANMMITHDNVHQDVKICPNGYAYSLLEISTMSEGDATTAMS